MTSDPPPTAVFVWVWLPGAVEPVVARRLFRQGKLLAFNYGRSYLARPDAIAVYLKICNPFAFDDAPEWITALISM